VAIFLTGSTGYIGAHVAANLLATHGASLNLLVRAKDAQDAEMRLWRAMQLHLEFPRFYEFLQASVRIFRGDLTAPLFGLSRDDYDRLVHTTDSVIHCAASLNRKSEKTCLNVNLRGTLEVIQLARRSQYYHGLRRFSDVSTVAVAGKRSNEVVTEDAAIDWNRSDYDPYARTKKFGEHMLRELLPDTPLTVFRPSIVLGDSRVARPQLRGARDIAGLLEPVRLAFEEVGELAVLTLRRQQARDRIDRCLVARAIFAWVKSPTPNQTSYPSRASSCCPAKWMRAIRNRS